MNDWTRIPEWRRASLVLAVFCLTICIAQPVLAQSAQLSGFVSDQQGTGFASAEITLVNDLTGLQRVTRSDERGNYVLALMVPGGYRLEVATQGFEQHTRTGVQSEGENSAQLDMTLQIDARSESGDVVAAVPTLNSREGSVGTTIDRHFAENVPMNGRTFHALIELAPGVTTYNGRFAANGQRLDSNYFTVDGVSGNVTVPSRGSLQDSASGPDPGNTIAEEFNGLTSLDALQEIRIQTSTFTPEFGRSAGAQVSVVTRSGKDSVNGSFLESSRDDAFNANDWFTNNKHLPEQSLRQYGVGGSPGGPLVRNNLFYFGTHEGLWLREPCPLVSTVPSLQAGRIDPASMRPLLDAYPLPTRPDLGNFVAEHVAALRQFNLVGSRSLVRSRHQFKINVDSRRLNPSLQLRTKHDIYDGNVQDALADPVNAQSTLAPREQGWPLWEARLASVAPRLVVACNLDRAARLSNCRHHARSTLSQHHVGSVLGGPSSSPDMSVRAKPTSSSSGVTYTLRTALLTDYGWKRREPTWSRHTAFSTRFIKAQVTMSKATDISAVDLAVSRPANVRILIGQPAWEISDWRERNGLWFLRSDAMARVWLDRFFALATTYAVDIVLLPELSVPASLVRKTRLWSERSGSIVVAGSHYVRTGSGYVARSPVIIAGDIYFIDKFTPAPVETLPILGQGLNPGRLQCVFKNTAAGSFGVLICSDYLEQGLKRAMFSHDLDLLFVPAFQRKSKLYHSRMSNDCEESESGIYIAYGNNLCRGYGDGHTALFGLMDNMFVDKLQRANATDRQPPYKLCQLSASHHALVVDVSLNAKRPFANHTIRTRPNVVLVDRAA